MRTNKAMRLFAAAALMLTFAMRWASAQQPPAPPAKGKGIDADDISKRTGVFAILLETKDGFQLHLPDRRLKQNIRLDVGDPAFLARYLSEQPLASAIDQPGALQIARGLVQQAIQHRHKGELQAAYYLYRFALANLAASDDVTGLDIVSHNVWALRGAARVRDEGQPAGGGSKPLLDLVVADGLVLQGLLAADPRYAQAALEADGSLRRVRIVRRIADLAGKPSGFAAHAARALAAGSAAPIPIGWITPAAEELASRELVTLLAAQGRVQADQDGFATVWKLYSALRGRIHEVANVAELGFVLNLATHNYARMRGQAVAAGGTFGHELSMFVVSEHLQAFGRDLVTLAWRRGSREQALGLAEEMQSRALTDWLARSHASNRLVRRAGVSGSLGEVRPASIDEMRDLARRRAAPILVYFKAVGAYFLWLVMPDGKVEHADLDFGRADLAGILQAFHYGSEDSPVATSVRGGRGGSGTRSGSGATAPDAEIEAKRLRLAELRRKVLPDAILQRIKGHAKLIVVPDGLVNFVPFAALVDDEGRYLIDTRTLQMLPAVTTGLVLEGSSEVRRVARKPAADKIIAVPSQTTARTVEITSGGRRQALTFDQLPGAAEETARVAALLGGKVSPTIPTRSREYLPVLHFATHGFFHVDSPLSSFLILPQGELTARQLYFGAMHIETGLVTMSACQTGLGGAHPDSALGLANGFLVAGAQSVLSTLWIISDDATLELMQGFYRGVADGKALDEALRQAQLALKAQPQFADPYYWAAFQLTGAERNPL
jgi:hypothetical protein